MVDHTHKEELIRDQLSHLGFDLERDDFDYSVRDRREGKNMPALQPTRCRDLAAIVALFKLNV
jgi:hypothetical protein